MRASECSLPPARPRLRHLARGFPLSMQKMRESGCAVRGAVRIAAARRWRRMRRCTSSSRSVCVANGRLGHADEGRGEGSEWLEAGLRGPATSGPGRGSSPGHQRAIAAQIRDEDSHRVDDSAHGSRRLRDGKTAVNHMWASTTSGCTPRPWSYMPTRLASEAVIQKRPDRLEEVLPGDRLRWVAAGVLEAAKGFRLGKGGKDMPALVAVLRARDVRLGLGESAL